MPLFFPLVDLDVINSKLVHALKQLSLNRIRTEIELHQKIHDLQAEFDSKLATFDEKRKLIVSGDYVPTEEESKFEFVDPAFPPPTDAKDKGIPQFWSIIFHNLDIIAEMVQEEDEPLLNHLVDLRYKIITEPRVSKHLPRHTSVWCVTCDHFKANHLLPLLDFP